MAINETKTIFAQIGMLVAIEKNDTIATNREPTGRINSLKIGENKCPPIDEQIQSSKSNY